MREGVRVVVWVEETLGLPLGESVGLLLRVRETQPEVERVTVGLEEMVGVRDGEPEVLRVKLEEALNEVEGV